MDIRRLRAGEIVAAVSGALLILSLFLPWYGYKARAEGLPTISTDARTGIESFAVVDVLLAGLGVAGIALVVVTAAQRTVAVPIAQASLTTLAGMVVTAILLVRLGSIPDPPKDLPEVFGSTVITERKLAPVLALVSTVGVGLGAALAMRDERLSRPGRRPTDATGRPRGRAPEVDPLPAPDPAESRR